MGGMRGPQDRGKLGVPLGSVWTPGNGSREEGEAAADHCKAEGKTEGLELVKRRESEDCLPDSLAAGLWGFLGVPQGTSG